MENLLLALFLFPFISALISFIFPLRNSLALILSLLPLLILLYGHGSWIGTDLNYSWLPALSINFHLYVDSFSLIFLYLTAVIIPITLLATNKEQESYSQFFYGLVFLLQGLLIGFFTTRDLAVFVLFYEAMLIPLYFIINIWGGSQRHRAALQFIIYMIAGSALMIAAALYLYFAAGNTFDFEEISRISSTIPYAAVLFFVFLLAFAVKTPLFPFHGWLPDAYYQASTAGTILLSSLLSKAGIYGIIRVIIELFPDLLQEWSPILLALAIAGVFYGAFAAWMQNDFKRLIAYSSLSHVNFILVGLFIWSPMAHYGAVLQALNHGITIAALFLVVGWLQERLGTTIFGHTSGLAKFLPNLCWLTLIFVLSSVALPGTNSFIGELMILFGLFGIHPWLTAFLGLIVIFSVVYMLRWMQKVYFESPGFFQERWVDIKAKEMLIALPLVVLIFWIGIYPTPFLKLIEQGKDPKVTVENTN